MTIRYWPVLLLICLMFTLIVNISSGQSLTNVLFVAFDTETTGLDARSGRVIEIGAVRFQNGKVLATTNWLINPEMPIPTNSQAIHHITDEMVAEKPKSKQVLPEFIAFIKGATLLAHNAQFDVKFIRAELRRCGLQPPDNNVLDTLRLSRAWFPETKSHEWTNWSNTLNCRKERFIAPLPMPNTRWTCSLLVLRNCPAMQHWKMSLNSLEARSNSQRQNRRSHILSGQ